MLDCSKMKGSKRLVSDHCRSLVFKIGTAEAYNADFCFNNYDFHCTKSVQKRSFFWSVFSRIWTEYTDLRSTVKLPNSGHLRVCAKLPAIRRCPLLGGSKEIFKF